MTEINLYPVGVPQLTDNLLFQQAAGGIGSYRRVELQNLLASTETAYVRTLFVAQHGTDSGLGDRPEAPLLTLDAATTKAAALNPSEDERVVIRILDAGRYTEAVQQPDHCDIIGDAASLYGTVALGDSAQLTLHRVRATADGQTLLSKTSGTGTSYCRITELDGTGPGAAVGAGLGSRTNVFCAKNEASNGVLFLWTPKAFAGEDGIVIGDRTTGGGHFHWLFQDAYGAGNNALLVAANIVQSDCIIIGGHMLEINGATGVVGIKMGSSGECAATITQIKLPNGTPYDVTSNSNRDLFLVCPHIVGTPIGRAQAEFSNQNVISPDMPTEADISGAPSGTQYRDTTAGNVVKVVV
jgi:hypothetical protein